MNVRAVIDRGFEAVKGYVDRGFLAVAERQKALEAENIALRGRLADLEGRLTSITPRKALIDRSGVLFFTLGDGSVQELGNVVGKDADPAEVRALVEQEVARLPKPRDGEDADPSVLRGLVAELVDNAIAQRPAPEPVGIKPEDMLSAEAVREIMTKALAERPPTVEVPAPRLDVDDFRPMLAELVDNAVAALPAPQPGKDADPEVIKALVEDAIGEAVAALPEPQPGKDADPEVVKALVAEAVKTAVAALPAPQPGKDADPAQVRALVDAAVARGLEALPALPAALTAEDVRPMVAELVDNAIEQLPEPQPGKDADPEVVKAMVADAVKAAVAGIPPAADGIGFVDALLDGDGDLVLTRSDGQAVKVGHVKGAPGDTIESLDVESRDGGRRVILRIKVGEATLEKEFTTTALIDRGVWKEQTSYEAGDGVTYKGSYWIAEDDPPGRPGEDRSGWRLAVKRGRDGRDARGARTLAGAGV